MGGSLACAQTQADALNLMKKTHKLNVSAVVHMFRHAVPQIAEQHNVRHESIKRMGWTPSEVLPLAHSVQSRGVLCCVVLRCAVHVM